MSDHIMLAVFAILLGGLGIMLITVGCRELVLQRRSFAHAVPVEATILSTKVTSSRSMDTDSRILHDNSTTSHTPEVRFVYTFRGERFESDLLYPTIIRNSFSSKEEAAMEIAEYKVGATTKAFADASHPERAFLRMDESRAPVWFIIAGCMSFALLALILQISLGVGNSPKLARSTEIVRPSWLSVASIAPQRREGRLFVVEFKRILRFLVSFCIPRGMESNNDASGDGRQIRKSHIPQRHSALKRPSYRIED